MLCQKVFAGEAFSIEPEAVVQVPPSRQAIVYFVPTETAFFLPSRSVVR